MIKILASVLCSLLVLVTSSGSCAPNCLTCLNPSHMHCTSCDSGASLNTPPDGQCFCNPGKYPLSGSGLCLGNCIALCSTCSGPLATDCISCMSSAVLSGGICVPCDLTCLSCSGPAAGDCTSCKTGAVQASSPAACVCGTGFYPNVTPAACAPCDPQCLTCSAGTSSSCTLCKSFANLVGATCVCNTSYFPNPHSGACSPCNASCLSCNGSTAMSCLTCNLNAVLTGSSTCQCVLGYFPNPNAGSCSICHSTCGGCFGSLISNCSSCKSNASIGAFNTCHCVAGFYPNTDAANCQPCDTTCATCSNSLNTDCTSCKSGALFDSSTPRLCVCGLGYIGTPDAGNCVRDTFGGSCHFTCLLCSVINSSTDCSSCLSNAYLTAGNSCACLSYAFPDPDVASCKLCHATCAVCVTSASANSCTQCYTNAHLSIGSPSACECDSGFYPSSDSSNCQVCNPLCDTCEGPNAEQCFSCKSFAVLSDTPPSSCTCENGYYPNQNVGSCSSCDSSCELCLSAGASGCSKCKPGAFLSGSAPNSCSCNPGFYPSPDPGICFLCQSGCLTCDSPDACLSCRESALLISGKCVCGERAYHDSVSSNCVKCSEGCKTCSQTGCLQCEDGWFFLSNGCYLSCPAGFQAISSLCSPIDVTVPIPSLSVDLNNTLIVTFDKDMLLSLLSTDIFIQVTDLDGALYIVHWSAPLIASNKEFHVQLKFESDYLPANNEVVLIFQSPKDVKDTAHVSITKSELKGVLHPFGTQPSSTSSNSPNTQAKIATTASSAAILTGVASTFLSGNPSSLWSLLNQLQLITYIPMTQIPISEDLRVTLNSLTLNSMMPISIPNLDFSEDNNCGNPPHFAANYDLQSSVFLSNVETLIGGAVSSLIVYLLISAIVRLNISGISLYFARILPSFKWGIPLRWWLQAYLDIAVFSMVQLYDDVDFACLRNAYSLFNGLLAAIGFISAVISPFLLSWFLHVRFSLVSSRENARFNKRWGELFILFKPISTDSNIFYAFFLFRRLIYAIILTSLSQSPKSQALLSTSLSLSVPPTQMFMYISICRPFLHKLDQLCESALEFSTFIVFVISSCFVFNISKCVLDHIGEYGAWVVIGAIVVNGLLSVARMIVSMYELIQEFRRRRKRLKVRSETSISPILKI